jgi:hypothetical protein
MLAREITSDAIQMKRAMLVDPCWRMIFWIHNRPVEQSSFALEPMAAFHRHFQLPFGPPIKIQILRADSADGPLAPAPRRHSLM